MLSTSAKEAFPPLLLLVNTLTLFNLSWLMLRVLLEDISPDEMLLVSASYYIAIMISSIIGGVFLRERLRKRSFLFGITLVGTCLYILAANVIDEKTVFNFTVTTFFIGASLGVIMPICLTFLADYTKIEGRGRLGGFTLFLVQFFTVAIYILGGNLSNITTALLILAGWRLVGAVGLLFYKERSKKHEMRSLKIIIRDRLFFLYFIPWFMFCLVNFVEIPLLERFFGPEMFAIHVLVEVVVIGISAFLGGLLCDFKGRRVASITGFILLGLSYAILNIFPEVDMAKVLFIITEGISWGILHVTFIFVIWGDISEGKTREGYYLLGGAPFLLSGLIQAITQQYVMVIPIYTSFSLASFFLFLAVIPLLYATETLPEKKLRERELRSYIEKAKKVREKFTKG